VRTTSAGESLTWFVYVIQSQVTERLYTGISNDPIRRLDDHNGSKRGAKATRAGRPWKLVYVEKSLTKGEALHREYEVKQLPREKKLGLRLGHREIEETLTRRM
jgi:putative endonuclease